jgi:hypothetical protein
VPGARVLLFLLVWLFEDVRSKIHDNATQQTCASLRISGIIECGLRSGWEKPTLT